MFPNGDANSRDFGGGGNRTRVLSQSENAGLQAVSIEDARRLRDEGRTLDEVAALFGVHRNTVYTWTTPGAKQHKQRQGRRNRQRRQERRGYVPPVRISVDRLRPILLDELESISPGYPLSKEAMQALAERCRVGWTTIDRIARKRGARTTEDVTDRILCGLGATYLWHLPADQGGFADMYEREAA